MQVRRTLCIEWVGGEASSSPHKEPEAGHGLGGQRDRAVADATTGTRHVFLIRIRKREFLPPAMQPSTKMSRKSFLDGHEMSLRADFLISWTSKTSSLCGKHFTS